MKDSEFKNLDHPVGDNVLATTGSEVAAGYRPDVTVRDVNGRLKYIIESEQKTDRKAFLGDVLKAEVFADQQEEFPELIIVMQEFPNTTTLQISDHLRPYARWLAEKSSDSLHLSAIQVLSDVEYVAAIESVEILGSQEFKSRGHVLWRSEEA